LFGNSGHKTSVKHLIICREYPPAPSGGIGTYVDNISRLLAENGETVHVIGQLWQGAERPIEERCNGRLIIHRVPFEDWTAFLRHRPSSLIRSKTLKTLFQSECPAQCFSWLAGQVAERLVEEEGIDIIEAQEYEAPLYYFQLRRAQGLGPRRRPPCLVHLHSPTEFIARYNDWSSADPHTGTTKALEESSIANADGLVCPSGFLARQVETKFGMPEGSIETIPYPLCRSEMLDRAPDTWSQGNISYVGRLERRKGAMEWIGAAVKLAMRYPKLRFEFIGANVLGPNRIASAAIIDRMIPRSVRSRFVFRGELRRSAIPAFLKAASIAVVPSRWDNFPNSCMEAMASGLPVLASRHGGMAEMIVDGETGWLVDKAEVGQLAEGMTRALETPPSKIAEMGSDASTSIRQICDPQKVVERQLNLRIRLAKTRPLRSVDGSSARADLTTGLLLSDRMRRLRRIRQRCSTIGSLVTNPILSIRALRELTSR
jgi:glycosyltransferase involved in cell wall biosynthesis